MTAQEALDSHPTATKAHVNKDGEWHFSTPPSDFIVVEVLEKNAISTSEEIDPDQKSSKKSKNK